MKNWNWKQWTAFGLIVAVIVAEVISVFVAPWAAVLGAAIAVFAFIAGRMSVKHIDIKGNDNIKEENAARMGWN